MTKKCINCIETCPTCTIPLIERIKKLELALTKIANFNSNSLKKVSPLEYLSDTELKNRDYSLKRKAVLDMQKIATAALGNQELKPFTREDLSKMSPQEFKQNEKIIFEQIKKGLVK